MKNELQYFKPSDIPVDISKLLTLIEDPFKHFATEYQQIKYFTEKGLFVKPVSVILGNIPNSGRSTIDGNIELQIRKCDLSFIPMRKTLKLFFEVAGVLNANIFYCCCNCRRQPLNQILGCNESFPVIIFIEFAEQTKN